MNELQKQLKLFERLYDAARQRLATARSKEDLATEQVELDTIAELKCDIQIIKAKLKLEAYQQNQNKE